jgi:hypothetical protein
MLKSKIREKNKCGWDPEEKKTTVSSVLVDKK